jgi:LysM repeat protein
MNGKKLLSLMVVLGLLISFSLLISAPPVWADKDTSNAKEGGSNKILVTGLQPGESVFTYEGDSPLMALVANAAPPGNFAARIDAPVGGQIETFAPVGKTTTVYVLNQATNAYRLIGIVSPGSSEPDTILNAQQTVQLAFGPGIVNKGLASPITGNPQPSMQQPAGPQSSMPSSQPSMNNGAASPSSFANFTQSYTVVSGDTLSALAKTFGTTVSNLAAANSIADPNLIRVGQQLKVPATAAQPAQPSMQQPQMQPQQPAQPSTGSSTGY